MKPDTQIIKYFLFFLLLVCIGCAAKDNKPDETITSDFEKWQKLAKRTPAYSPSPREIDTKEYRQKTRSEQIEELQIPDHETKKEIEPPLPDKKLPSVKVSMQMHDVDIGVLFRTLAKAADVNIILNKTITGKASVNIKELPWSQVFEGLLNSYGYTYIWMGDIIRVVSIDDLNKQASLMEAKQMMEVKYREHDIALMALNTEKENMEPLKTRVVHVDYADPVELRNNLWEFLKVSKSGYQDASSGDEESEQGKVRGSILVDKHNNSLMIQATPNDMLNILELMETLDKPTPQIRIEAFIVETTAETARELGVQWGGLGLNTTGNRQNWIGGPLGTPEDSLFTTSDDATDDAAAGSPISYLPGIGAVSNFPSSSTAGTSGWNGLNLGLMTQNIGNYLLYAQLTALQEEGKLNIISKPSITTLDNQKAIIESGRDIPYTSFNEGENTVEFKKAVLKLEATPHVIDRKNLKIKIITNKDELDFSNSVEGNPVILTKYAETEVVLQDGQTTVIGGLGKQTNSAGESGVPGLMDIPFLGKAFKQDNKNIQMEDILIFITPHILKPRARNERQIEPISILNEQISGQTDGAIDDNNADKNNEQKKVGVQYSFSLQAGVFASKENADRLLAKLSEKGYSAYLFETINSKNKNLYSVRVKDFMDLKSAFEAENEFREKEKSPAIVAFYNMLETVPREIKQ